MQLAVLVSIYQPRRPFTMKTQLKVFTLLLSTPLALSAVAQEIRALGVLDVLWSNPISL
jgi:hypothetical protein